MRGFFSRGIAVATLSSAACLAQVVNVASEDTRLKTAKTVVVLIQAGQSLPSPYPPDLGRAKKQLLAKIAKWKRLTVVAEPEKADIVMVITEFNQNAGAIANAYGTTHASTAVVTDRNCLANEVKVYAGGKRPEAGDTPIWGRVESCGWSWPLNRALDAFWKSAR